MSIPTETPSRSPLWKMLVLSGAGLLLCSAGGLQGADDETYRPSSIKTEFSGGSGTLTTGSRVTGLPTVQGAATGFGQSSAFGSSGEREIKACLDPLDKAVGELNAFLGAWNAGEVTSFNFEQWRQRVRSAAQDFGSRCNRLIPSFDLHDDLRNFPPQTLRSYASMIESEKFHASMRYSSGFAGRESSEGTESTEKPERPSYRDEGASITKALIDALKGERQRLAPPAAVTTVPPAAKSGN